MGASGGCLNHRCQPVEVSGFFACPSHRRRVIERVAHSTGIFYAAMHSAGVLMAKVVLASALARWLPSPTGGDGGEVSLMVSGDTVREVLEHLFALYPVLRGYVVDERGALRRHVALFVDGNAIHHNSDLQQALGERADVHVLQALSGG